MCIEFCLGCCVEFVCYGWLVFLGVGKRGKKSCYLGFFIGFWWIDVYIVGVILFVYVFCVNVFVLLFVCV